MINVGYTNNFGYHSELVEGSTTIQDFCTAHHIAIGTGRQVLVNGVVVSADEFDTKLSEYANDAGDVDLATMAKMDNA